MRKKKVKLTKEQKKVYDQLQLYVDERIKWIGDQDLKEVAQEGGWYAVFSISGDPEKIKARYGTTECYESIILTDSREGAMAIMNFNPSTHALAVNLKWHSLVEERRKPYAPMENVVYE